MQKGDCTDENSSKTVKIDIVGACPSRDLISLVNNERFVVCKYFSLLFAPSFDNSPLLESGHVTPDQLEGQSGYIKRINASELNRTVIQELNNSGAEWVLLDMYNVTRGLNEVCFGGEKHYYSGRWVSKHNIEQSVKEKGMQIDSFKKIELDEYPEVEESIDLFCEYLKSRYGKHIILVELKPSLWQLDGDGAVNYTRDVASETMSRYMDKYFIKFLERLDCYYIKTPPNVICDSYHKFGPDRVHYVQDWYEYSNAVMELIVNEDPDYLRKSDL